MEEFPEYKAESEIVSPMDVWGLRIGQKIEVLTTGENPYGVVEVVGHNDFVLITETHFSEIRFSWASIVGITFKKGQMT